jgi:hypothetical protein
LKDWGCGLLFDIAGEKEVCNLDFISVKDWE